MNISLTTKAPTPPALITNLSDEQVAAVNFVTTTTSNLVLIAPAGSGKSYTLEAILCAINNTYPTATCALLSFNSKIETELDTKVRKRGILNTTVRTAHKYGKRACENHLGTFRRDTIDKYKIHKLLSKYPIPIPYAVAKSIERLISLGKDAGVGIFLPNIRSTWEALFNHHDIDHDDDKFPLSRYFTIAENILTLSNADTKTLDIADLIYLPLLHMKNGYGLVVSSQSEIHTKPSTDSPGQTTTRLTYSPQPSTQQPYVSQSHVGVPRLSLAKHVKFSPPHSSLTSGQHPKRSSSLYPTPLKVRPHASPSKTSTNGFPQSHQPPQFSVASTPRSSKPQSTASVNLSPAELKAKT